MTYPDDPLDSRPPDYSDVPESDLTDADRERIARRHRMYESWRREYHQPSERQEKQR